MEKKKLSNGAYGGVSGKEYTPYVTTNNKIGVNFVVLILGILLAALFAASTTYSGLKAGLTVAAGIPGAILGAGVMSIFAKNNKVLKTNLLQGMSSGGESIASGIIFVLPAVFVIGGDLTFFEGLVTGVGGAILGLGFASLVHNYLIVEEHGKLFYPEALAISETLVASDTGGESLKFMGIGFGIGGLLTAISGGVFTLVNNVVSFVGDKAYKWSFSLEVNPLLIGIGFIVGLEVSLTMFAGSILANFGVIPLIGYFSDFAADGLTVWNDSSIALNEMTSAQISGAYSKYIGAGMMLCGGIIGAAKLLPVIYTSLKETFTAKTESGEGNTFGIALLGAGVAISFIAGFIITGGNITLTILATLLSMVLMLLFVIVAGRLTGTIGTSNLPVSGMTIASLVIVTLLFMTLGYSGVADNKTLLLFGTLIVTAIAIAGGYMQSQKVTFIMGGHKNDMQKYFSVAAVTGVIVVIGTIMLLKEQLIAGDSFAMPQANLMATLTSGIMQGNLPWVMIFVGIFLAVVVYLLKLPIMTVAIGFYLPIATTSIILVGALIRVVLEMREKNNQEVLNARVSNGVSLSSGLVAGGSIIGLIGIALNITGVIQPTELLASGNVAAIVLLLVLVVLMVIPIYFMKIKSKDE